MKSIKNTNKRDFGHALKNQDTAWDNGRVFSKHINVSDNDL